MATSKKFDDEVMLENCDFIVIFPIYWQFGGIQNPDSRTWSIKLLLSLIVAFRLTKTESRPKKSLRSNTIALNKGIKFAKKCCYKNLCNIGASLSKLYLKCCQ